jgi:hypothetical protein
MAANELSWTSFRDCIELLLCPKSWELMLKQAGFRVRAPARVSSYDVITGLVFHFLRREGTLSSHMKEATGQSISDSALAQRRQALPWQTFELLLAHVLKPRATPQEHPEAFWKGWRLCAIDGTQASVMNTPQVLAKMGKAVTRRLKAAFAKVQLAVVVEIGLHNPLGAAIGTQRESEMELARRVVEKVPEGSLLIADRYYGNKAFIAQLRAADPRGLRSFLLRVKSNLKARVIQALADGSALVEIQCGKEKVTVREVRARVGRAGRPVTEVRLWTSLLDAELYPARELMEVYAKRWEEEVFFKEFKIDVHPRGGTLLQSHTEETAAQELAALFVGMALLAERRMEAAAVGEVPVLRISLGKTLSYLEALWQVLGAAEGILSKAQITALISKVTEQIAEACLPKRRERNCPRKVRQPVQRYPRLTKNDSVTGPTVIEITGIAG